MEGYFLLCLIGNYKSIHRISHPHHIARQPLPLTAIQGNSPPRVAYFCFYLGASCVNPLFPFSNFAQNPALQIVQYD